VHMLVAMVTIGMCRCMFGGFTTWSWKKGTNKYVNAEGSFVFRLTLNGAVNVIVLKATPGHAQHVCCG